MVEAEEEVSPGGSDSERIEWAEGGKRGEPKIPDEWKEGEDSKPEGVQVETVPRRMGKCASPVA